jgi:NAD(P)-dependent dehydrogenase (short-subunit alcohol dehydrogenase family)
MLLTAKSALVTGAANRLGAQIARTLHQNGANLIIHYYSSLTAARALVDELNQLRVALLTGWISWLTMHPVSTRPGSVRSTSRPGMT